MYKLYGKTGTCSMAVHVILNELNQKVEYIPAFDASGKKTAEFLKINPVGQVPVLVDNGHAMSEGGAIIAYLLDKHNSPMLPKSGAERATALQWLMFANSTMHPAYGRGFFLLANLGAEAASSPLMAATVKRINELWAIVDEQLGKTPYVCGKSISGADILLSVIANWSHYIPGKITFGNNVTRLLKEVSNRPAFKQALSEEKVEYKAAA